MNKQFDIKLAEARWVLGLTPIEELPALAENALADGIESESILRLAVCSVGEIDEITRLFKRILVEAGGGNMLKIEALKYYAKQIATQILSSEISPQQGVRLIWTATINAKEKDFHELDAFIYAASEMDDRPADKEFFEQAILEEAKRWCEAGQEPNSIAEEQRDPSKKTIQ